MFPRGYCAWFVCLLSIAAHWCHAAEAGRDLIPVFIRAEQGGPLRYVAIGGSITQGGNGWIGDWLRQQFPKSAVAAVNSGMSATGSELAMFRAPRDIIAHQPDLVALEFCVNDGNLADDEAIRCMETLVVRLKSLPKPPAIVIIEAAAQGGVNLARHRKVAQHYGLLEINLQDAIDQYLKKTSQPWSALFTDAVHPNEAGHAFYARVIEDNLRPFIAKAWENPEVQDTPLPHPLSTKPLLLDARMVLLSSYTGWKREPSVPFWWNMFFSGLLAADTPGNLLVFPFRGTTVGLFYAMDKTYGSFYASVDEATPQEIRTNTRGGYYYSIIGRDLLPEEHRLSVVLPQPEDGPQAFPETGPVKLGYALVAGETGAGSAVASRGTFHGLRFESLRAGAWSIAGPYPIQSKEMRPPDYSAALDIPYPPETGAHDPKLWHSLPRNGALIDFAGQKAPSAPGVIYASTSLYDTFGCAATLRLTVDFFARIWLNGKQIGYIRSHDGPYNPILIPIALQAGSNDLLVKVVSGSRGHSFSVSIAKEEKR